MNIKNNIKALKYLDTNLFGKDFLLTWEKSIDDLKAILLIAEILNEMRVHNISPRIYDSGLAVSLFRDKSTRTRFSYASACNLLGLEIQDLDETKSQISHGETVRETANMISFLTDFIGIRDDMYLGEGNKYMRKVADSLDDGYKKGILPTRPGIVNLQCDMDHPTQSMADLMHLKQYFGSLNELKGKKIVMSWAYSPSYGKPLSVPQGIIALMTRFGMDVELTYPKTYDLIPEITELAKQNAQTSGTSFNISHNMKEALKNADIVYPKSWAPYHIMQERTSLLQKSDIESLKKLEEKCLEENAKFKDWEYNEDMMKETKNSNALYMHCLPADISEVSCSRGEVSKQVFEKYRMDTYKEAGYKPYIIAAMIIANKFKQPEKILKKILDRNTRRFGF